MSAMRRKPNRSNRAVLSSPYARPVKKSSWSLTGILSYLNPLRLRSSRDEESMSLDESDIESDDSEQDQENYPTLPVSVPSKREHQLVENVVTNGHALPGPPPPASSLHSSSQRQDRPPASSSKIPSVEFTFKASSSPAQNLDTVSNFLAQHANRPIAPEDINQMVTLIQQSKPEPFRFESRAVTSPPRSKSPSVPHRSASAAPRTLTRNPNGVYTWKGAGSARARRARNNFASPAFRIPRSTTTRSGAPDAENTGNDAKRRKIGNSADESPASSASNQVPFPVTTTAPTSRNTRTGPSLKPPSVSTSTPRQRTPGLQKPTTPVVPSPLRQAWTGGSPSGSEPGSPQGPGTLRQTETARHVTELVNSLKSQDKVLDDLRNPYEWASPVKRPTVPKRKRVTAPAKKPASTTTAPKEVSTAKTKVKEISAHDIIEATLPEGSKRSRPPHFEKPSEKPAPQSKELRNVTIIEEDDVEAPLPKRSKPSVNGHTAKELVDIEMESSQPDTKEKKDRPAPIKVPVIAIPPSQPSTATKSIFGPKSSQPKEPSKLRFSVQAESTSTPPSPAPEPRAELEETPKPVQSLPPATEAIEKEEKDPKPSANFLSIPAPAAPPPLPKSAKDIANAQPLASLPSFTFTFPPPFTFGNKVMQDEVKAMPRASLPFFDLTKPIASSALTNTINGGFDWSAADAKVPVASTDDQWTCSTCMLKNPSSATEKCTVCDAPKPGAESKKPTASFNWGAAGMKPVNEPSGDEWTCSTCSLKNPTTATDKCTICDAPKPGGVAPSKTASFDWGTAGLKAAASAGSAEWTCGLCQLKNPADAKEKCTICDAPRS